MSKKSTILICVLCSLWFLTICAGMAVMLKYENTSGTTGRISGQWPANTPLKLDSQHDTLVMFAHPQCSCSYATMEELNRLMAKCGERLSVRVLFLKPKNFPTNWVEAGLWHSASAIPGVTAQEDPGGLIASRFGAETSGYVLLYNPQGQLLFSGGITGSRGHAGDNEGEDTVIALVTGQNTSVKSTPVYGCSLLNKPGLNGGSSQ